MSRGWGFTPPDAFSVRWSGFLFIDADGEYTFSTRSDDGSEVYVDGRLVVDNGGTHGGITRSGSVRLDHGPHAIVINYVNVAGGYEMDWSWGRAGEPPRTVPSWLLSTRARGYPTLVAIRAVEWLWPISVLVAFGLSAWLFANRGWWPAHRDALNEFRVGARPALACLAFFAAAAVAQTWPLARDPAHLSRNDNADTMLNEWAIAWVAHELPRAPQHLFDANMFYPERHTLAYSEALVVQGVMAMPLFALRASPVLAYNLVLLAGLALTGWATSLLVAKWTEDWIAGAAAGLMVAFNAHTLTRLPHLQAQHVEFLPLALLALDALLRRPRWSYAAWLAIGFVLQALTSVYLLVFTAIALAVGALVRPEDWWGARAARLAPRLAAAAILAAAALFPFLLPYWQVHRAGITRSLDEAGFFAATYRDYLTTAGRFHTWIGGGSALFPGFAALGLASVAILSGTAIRDARARMCLAFGACGVLLSFGPAVAPGYEFLFSTVPLLQPIRTSSRFGYLGLFALAILAGYGVATIRRTLRARPRTDLALAGVVLAFAFLDPFAAPIPYTPFTSIPALYARPAADAHAIVAELPLAPPEFQYRDAASLLHSTRNWRPLLNGYSGFTPPGYVQRYIAMNRFPDGPSIAALQDAGVNTLFIHTDQFTPADLAAIDQNPSLHLIDAAGQVGLYSLAPHPN